MHDVYAYSDIHGMYNLHRAILDYCYEQDDSPMIIFCGDACDRGPDGYRIMRELLDDPYIVYLKGNHEDMFCKAAREIKEWLSFKDADRERVKTVLNSCRTFDYHYPAIQDSLGNGGIDTLTDWVMDGMPMEFVECIEHLPLTFSTDTCDFCHAGVVPQTFARVSTAEYYGEPVDEYDEESLLWSRSAFNYGWTPNRICIHGHTPVPYLLEEWDEDKGVQPHKYFGSFDPSCTGAKIDMDTGAAFAGRAWVLNCLTMMATGFEKNVEVKKIETIRM